MSLVNCHCRALGRIEPITITPNSFNKRRPSSINLNYFLANLTDIYANNLLFSCVVAVPPLIFSISCWQLEDWPE
jgi:hypothetical protein